MMMPVEIKRRRRIDGSTLMVTPTGASTSVQFWRVANNSVINTGYSFATTNSTTKVDGITTDGRNIYVLHDLGTTYQFDAYRRTGQFLYTSGTFAGTSFVTGVGLDWDGRNILVFYQTSEANRNLRCAIHRMNGTFVAGFQILRGSSLGSINGCCWDGNGLWALTHSGAVGSGSTMRRHRWLTPGPDSVEVYTYGAGGTVARGQDTNNGRSTWGLKAGGDQLSEYRHPFNVDVGQNYAFDGNKSCLCFA